MVTTKVRRARILGVVILLVIAALVLPVSCDTGNSDDATVPVGEWTGPNPDFPDSYTITATTVSYTSTFGSREAAIISVTEGSLNAGDTALGSNVDEANTVRPGYAIIRYTEPVDIADSYNVFRWGALDDASEQKYMAESYVGFDIGQYDTAEAARTGATTASGAFFLGEYTKQ